jgi:heptosyltransferase-2
MVLTTPLISYLADRGAVDVICTPAAAALLANNPLVRETIVYDKRGKDRGVGGFLRMASRLRAAKYDAAYHAQG